MYYSEEIKNLFAVSDEYYLVHCISADFKMSSGIVIEFNKKFNMKNVLKNKFSDYIKLWRKEKRMFDCILEGRVFNLITKKRHFNKPTYESLRGALNIMKSVCVQNKITKIAMPLIGCGTDKLQWDIVSEIIKEIFEDTDIEILVCRQ